MKRVLVILGTRPEAIKLWPVINTLRSRDLDVRVASTNQQPDLLQPILDELGIDEEYAPLPAFESALEGKPLDARLGAWITWLGEIVRIARPDLVIVQGDTTTALAGALAAFYNQVPIAHVEAGLRTYDLTSPFPEEANRQMIARLATLHFAPTKAARAALRMELRDGWRSMVEADADKPTRGIFLVGNTSVDALHMAMKLPGLSHELPPADILVTFHRRESWPEAKQVVHAVDELAKSGRKVTWVLHKNVVGDIAMQEARHMRLVPALPYGAFVDQLLNAKLVITDSGGVVEEAVTIGVPTIMLRNATERSEALDAGADILGLDELHLLERAVDAQLTRGRNPSDVFGDGKTAERIADRVCDFLRAKR